MNWLAFFKLLFRNVIVGTVLAAGGLGTLGYFLAGRVGFENGLLWGALLGGTGGLMSALGMTMLLYWGGYSTRFGKEQFRQESEGETRWPK
ncbi:MAG: hypothetical protein HUU38_18890 [Anaerolineales bacterium]|jgi:hypothetical protein|nr:hypothetical protein [Anaerolineales bacterium]